MKNYLTIHPWKIIEDGYHPKYHLVSESIFSIGNGKMGMRGNFEEDFSGKSLQGNYLAGIYYPDKTKVGWWKNGYPEYFAKVLNAANWIGLSVKVNGQLLDLNQVEIKSYQAILDMKAGVFERHFHIIFPNGNEIKVDTQRFYSLVDDEIGTLKYDIRCVNFEGNIEIDSHLDFDVRNEGTNYDEKFWKGVSTSVNVDYGLIVAKTKKTNFTVAAALSCEVKINKKSVIQKPDFIKGVQKVTHQYRLDTNKGDTISVVKYATTVSSFFHDDANINRKAIELLNDAKSKSFDNLLKLHKDAWAKKWATQDIIIEGDDSSQQAIRFNIFMLNQTYTGKDHRLNIGPKGFTGEKYGGSTYWDTEAYCLPFYQSTSGQKIARNLLKYRHNHLHKAIENANKLGFTNGAALYPMVTMDGTECHNEWEITFEEIHRNGAIAYAIYDYIKYTGDESYVVEYGLDVLIGIARFWAQRFSYSQAKGKYVMLGVTGPNEYENNVNNNWYTLYIARWCMNYTQEMLAFAKEQNPQRYQEILEQNNFDLDEVQLWNQISDEIYLPFDEERGIFLQQDGYLDKELIPAKDIPKDEYPLHQNWSWDRILRSCFIKQADVLQGMYFFEEHFTKDELERNYDFYEPLTVHESSLSPCVHSILACSLGRTEKAYELFLRTSRLDLDDYNNDTKDGCHITSMAGTWLSIVKGFGGMRIKKNKIHFNPQLPKAWRSFSFRVIFRDVNIFFRFDKKCCDIKVDKPLEIVLNGNAVSIVPGQNIFNIEMKTIQ